MAKRLIVSGVDGGSVNNTGYDVFQPWTYFLDGDNVGGSGVVDPQRGHLLVAESSPAAMTVDVKRGAVIFRDNNAVPFLKRTYLGVVESDSDGEGLTVTANTSGTNRIDAAVAYVDLSAVEATRGEGHLGLAVVTGSGATALTDAALQTAVDALVSGYSDVPFTRLANITVADSASSIVTDNIASTRTAVSFGGIAKPDGWIKEQATVTRTGDYEFTLPHDATSYMKKGAYVEFVDSTSTLKEGVVIGSSYSAPNTTVTLAPQTTSAYDGTPANAMAAGAVASLRYRNDGYSKWFFWTPSAYSASGSMTFTSVTTDFAMFRVQGETAHVALRATGTTGGTAHLRVSGEGIPIAANPDATQRWIASALIIDGGTSPQGGSGYISGSLFIFTTPSGGNWGLGSGRMIAGNVSYRI